MFILTLGYLIVLGTAMFGVFHLDYEWWVVLTGTSLLFGTTIMNSAATLERRLRPHGTLQESLLIAIGLAALSNQKSPILFGFFCVAGFLCFVFWVWESFGRKLQKKGH